MTRALGWLLGVSLCLLAARARAEPLVIVVESEGQSAADAPFISALRLHVGSAARIETAPDLSGRTLASRIAEAAAIARARAATVVLWRQAAATGEGVEVVLYAVGARSDRALVELARVRQLERPEDHRVLALKVASFIDMLVAEADAERPLARTFARTARTPADDGAALTMEIGGAGALGGGNVPPRGGLLVGAGVQLGTEPYRVSLLASFHWGMPTEASGSTGDVVLNEVAAGLCARAALRHSFVSVGGSLELGARVIEARGHAVDGRAGELTRVVPVARSGAEGHFELAAGVALRLLVGAELALIRQRFFVAGEHVLDLGRLSGIAEVSVVIAVR